MVTYIVVDNPDGAIRLGHDLQAVTVHGLRLDAVVAAIANNIPPRNLEIRGMAAKATTCVGRVVLFEGIASFVYD